MHAVISSYKSHVKELLKQFVEIWAI